MNPSKSVGKNLLSLLVFLSITLFPGCNAQETEHGHSSLPSQKKIKKLAPDGGPEFNRLVFETSPYLLQHARNPVDWYSWSDEAFEKARKEDKPIFLSVGYSTCHWCHVMEKECFERDDVAVLLNKDFISIKVDREERPELDRIYMRATQIVRGRGGWPNSVWLTPDGKPFFAGTYFPREDRNGQPGFKSILTYLATAWKDRRPEILAEADRLEKLIQEYGQKGDLNTVDLSRKQVEKTLASLETNFDSQQGGYGAAPKFPPHQSLSFLLYEYRLRKSTPLMEQVDVTLQKMARGGIRDQVGGGFHRYSTDAHWHLPHFEKMLYDNAQLAKVYLDAYALTGREEYRQVVEELFVWVKREMTAPGGGCYSAQDADSDGEEGKYYVWSRTELHEILGKEDAIFLESIFNIRPEGNFLDEAHGKSNRKNILSGGNSPELIAAKWELKQEAVERRLRAIKAKLFKVRDKRIHPHLDDKILTSWNGLMISAYARGGEVLSDPEYLKEAASIADFLLKNMRKDGRLLHTYRAGEARLQGYLEDYAYFIEGLLDLYQASGEARWLKEANSLAEIMIRDFSDPSGGFFFTAKDHANLLTRTQNPWDAAVPSPNGVAARSLLRLAHYTGKQKYYETSLKTLDTFSGLMDRSGRGLETLTHTLAMVEDKAEGVEMPVGKKSLLKIQSSQGSESILALKGIVVDPNVRQDFRSKPITGTVVWSQKSVKPGAEIPFVLYLRMDKGWHINAHKPLEDTLKATQVLLQSSAGVMLKDVKYPEGEKVTFAFSPNQPLLVYGEEVAIRGTLLFDGELEEGSKQLSLRVLYQACDDKRCLLPKKQTLTITVKVDRQAKATVSSPKLFK